LFDSANGGNDAGRTRKVKLGLRTSKGNYAKRCLDGESGKEIWKDSYETAAATGPASSYSGPRSSPTVANGKVITYGLRATLSCYDTESGKLIWRKESVPNAWPSFFTSSSPLIEDGLCIAQLGGATNGVIAALNVATGEEKWRWSGDGSQYGSPMIGTIAGTKTIIAQTDKRMVALRLSDGVLLWEAPFAGSGMGGMNTSTPIVSEDILIYSGSGRGVKAVKFEKDGDSLKAVELWSNKDNSIQYNSPVLKDSMVFGYSAKDELFCIDAKDGKTLWTTAIPGKRGYGAIVGVEDALLLLTPTGTLTVFAPIGKEFKQIASYKVGEGGTTAHPLLTKNHLYVKDKDSLTKWLIE
jgi:outer membrane protein assembly factor BamB